ncbi:MAG: TauD/TfdA family dioxygenase [Magnetococcales bacterium]|nr:TauD/TfdA family dioxygenase [Magnetococcales bacterium]
MTDLWQSSPFNPANDDAYHAWRDAKLRDYPDSLGALVVDIADPFALSQAEREAIRTRVAKCNLAIYRLRGHDHARAGNPLRAITAQLGLEEIDHNLGAGEEGLSALSPGGSAHEPFAAYIPYRQAAIGWHTDGYYNPPHRQIRSLCLHCERPADVGGENALWDHEIAYIRLRDKDPEIIRTLMTDGVMTIPARLEGGQVARPERPGPVFAIDPRDGHLHMRFTNRTISIRWRQDAATREAVAALKELLEAPSPHLFRGRLEAGWGLLSHNPLHTREAFHDQLPEAKRTLYRARFFQRMTF